MPPATRYSCFVFTANNYSPEQEQWLQHTFSKSCSYLIYGHETAPTTGTPHLQGFYVLMSPGTKADQVKKFSRQHISVFLPTSIEKPPSYWQTYCSKEDVQAFQYGVCPSDDFYFAEIRKQGSGHRSDLDKACDLIKSGGTLNQVAQDCPSTFVRFASGLQRLQLALLPFPTDISVLDNYWYVGSTGVGKSRTVRQKFQDIYRKMRNKWWDGYINQATVLIEEVDPKDTWLASFLKEWADHYVFPAEFKGGVMNIRPQRIVVTSNYTIEQCFPDFSDIPALLRRFTVIKL